MPEHIETVQVMLTLPLGSPYDYSVPEGLTLAPGDFVEVPLGSRSVAGVVWGAEPPTADPARLKPVIGRIDRTPLPPTSFDFVSWVAGYTLSDPGNVLRMVVRGLGDGAEPKPRTAFTTADSVDPAIRMTPARQRVIEVLADGPPRPASQIAEIAGVSSGVVKSLADAGGLARVMLARDLPFDPPVLELPGVALSAEQKVASAAVGAAVKSSTPDVFLLDGVTGSGKTEVYFEAAAEAFARGRQVLILLPEIALTLQMIARFEVRFGVRPAVWHSGMKPRVRKHTWRAIQSGEAKVLIGARSALFLPFPDLGLIVVDEEHDVAYKQEDGVRYHARDMAVVRGQLSGAPVVLASATPSLESHVNANRDRYRRLVLTSRHGPARLPEIRALDIRETPPESQQWIAPPLRQALADNLVAGEQSLLFLNRRGYAPLTLCRTCGHRFTCPECSTWLVEHRFRGSLNCHHCGFRMPMPAACPECASTGTLTPCGPGVERLAEEATNLFPRAKIEILSSDHLESLDAVQTLITRAEEGDIDIMIGTQLVAKGHHFPNLTLVGVVDADLGLQGGDLRAGERTFQLMDQVSGRAGRADKPGCVFLQTCMPEHPVLRALVQGDRDGFLESELAARETLALPPFGRLAGIILSGPDEGALGRFARDVAAAIPSGFKAQVLGPAPAPIALLRGRWRMRFLVKARKAAELQAFLRAWLAEVKVPGAFRLGVDMDPYSFL